MCMQYFFERYNERVKPYIKEFQEEFGELLKSKHEELEKVSLIIRTSTYGT